MAPQAFALPNPFESPVDHLAGVAAPSMRCLLRWDLFYIRRLKKSTRVDQKVQNKGKPLQKNNVCGIFRRKKTASRAVGGVVLLSGCAESNPLALLVDHLADDLRSVVT